jgi:hypothetical protein
MQPSVQYMFDFERRGDLEDSTLLVDSKGSRSVLILTAMMEIRPSPADKAKVYDAGEVCLLCLLDGPSVRSS